MSFQESFRRTFECSRTNGSPDDSAGRRRRGPRPAVKARTCRSGRAEGHRSWSPPACSGRRPRWFPEIMDEKGHAVTRLAARPRSFRSCSSACPRWRRPATPARGGRSRLRGMASARPDPVRWSRCGEPNSDSRYDGRNLSGLSPAQKHEPQALRALAATTLPGAPGKHSGTPRRDVARTERAR